MIKIVCFSCSSKYQWKTLDAVIGDITITADRFSVVEYTQPYIESPLVLIVPGKAEDLEWTLVKPFSGKMWTASGGILAYTIFIIWFLERSVNPKFSGPLKNQIGRAIWFAFTSLFFSHSMYNSKISSRNPYYVNNVV